MINSSILLSCCLSCAVCCSQEKICLFSTGLNVRIMFETNTRNPPGLINDNVTYQITAKTKTITNLAKHHYKTAVQHTIPI